MIEILGEKHIGEKNSMYLFPFVVYNNNKRWIIINISIMNFSHGIAVIYILANTELGKQKYTIPGAKNRQRDKPHIRRWYIDNGTAKSLLLLEGRQVSRSVVMQQIASSKNPFGGVGSIAIQKIGIRALD